MNQTVLLVDDEPNVLEGLVRLLHGEPYVALTASTGDEAAMLLEDHPIDLIVCDEQMPGMSGTEFLAGVAREHPEITRIVLTGHPSLDTAICAINEGKVSHFFTKPVSGVGLSTTIRRALRDKDVAAKSRDLLEASTCQRTLIEEASLLRRVNEPSRCGRAQAVASRSRLAATRRLIREIDEEVRNTGELLRDVSRLTVLTQVFAQT